MILVFAVAMASADPGKVIGGGEDQDALHQRLLGDAQEDMAPANTQPSVEVPVGPAPLPWWMIGLGGLAMGALYLMRNQSFSTATPTPQQSLSVVSRTPLDRNCSAMVIDVVGLDGVTVRYLVGTGSEGTQMLAQVGGPPAGFQDVLRAEVAAPTPPPAAPSQPSAPVPSVVPSPMVMPHPMMGGQAAMTQPMMGMPYPAMGMPHPAMGMPHPATGMPHPAMGMPHPAMGMPHPAMGMPHPAMGMPHPAMGMPHPAMGMPHPQVAPPPTASAQSVAIPTPASPQPAAPVTATPPAVRLMDDLETEDAEEEVSMSDMYRRIARNAPVPEHGDVTTPSIDQRTNAGNPGVANDIEATVAEIKRTVAEANQPEPQRPPPIIRSSKVHKASEPEAPAEPMSIPTHEPDPKRLIKARPNADEAKALIDEMLASRGGTFRGTA